MSCRFFIRRDLGTSQSVCRVKNFLAAIYDNIGRKYSKILLSQETDRPLHCIGQTELSNMLVKKNVLNIINKEGAFTQGFKDCRKIKRKVSQNLDDLKTLLTRLGNC